MTDDRALFRSIEDALMWAYYFARVESNTIDGASFVRLIKDDQREQIDEKPRSINVFSIPTAPRPRGFDAAAQAGFIISFVNGLPQPESAHLKAKALRSAERREAQRAMRDVVRGIDELYLLSPGLIYELVAKHYGKRHVTMVSLAKKYRHDRRAVTSIRAKVEITLDAIGVRAEKHAYEYLQGQGVVQ